MSLHAASPTHLLVLLVSQWGPEMTAQHDFSTLGRPVGRLEYCDEPSRFDSPDATISDRRTLPAFLSKSVSMFPTTLHVPFRHAREVNTAPAISGKNKSDVFSCEALLLFLLHISASITMFLQPYSLRFLQSSTPLSESLSWAQAPHSRCPLPTPTGGRRALLPPGGPKQRLALHKGGETTPRPHHAALIPQRENSLAGMSPSPASHCNIAL
jgi:hypothetical protein